MVRRSLFMLIALVLVTAGCGNAGDEEVRIDDDPEAEESGGNTPADVDGVYLAEVGRDTLDANTGRFEQTTEMSGSMVGLDLDGVITSSGSYDTANASSSISMDMTDYMDAVMGGVGGGLLGGLGADMTMETIQIGPVTYIKSGLFTTLGAGSDTWVRVDVSELGEASELSGAGAGAIDPSNYLELLEGASDEIEDLGTADVRGTETTGYRVTVSIDEVAASMVDDPDAQAELDQLTEQLGVDEMLAAEVPIDVYVDGDGMVRRVVVSIDMGSMFGGLLDGMDGMDGTGGPGEDTTTSADASFSVTSTVDFFDFGADDIDIQPPPADQVTDFEKMLGSFTE